MGLMLRMGISPTWPDVFHNLWMVKIGCNINCQDPQIRKPVYTEIWYININCQDPWFCLKRVCSPNRFIWLPDFGGIVSNDQMVTMMFFSGVVVAINKEAR